MTCDCNKKIFTPQGWFDDISGNITDLSSNLISMDGSVLGNISSGLQNLLSPVAAQIIDIPDTATKLIQDVQWVGLKSPQDLSLDTFGYQVNLFSRVAPGIFDVNIQPMGDVCDDGFAENVAQCKQCLSNQGLSGKWALTREETQNMRACVIDMAASLMGIFNI